MLDRCIIFSGTFSIVSWSVCILYLANLFLTVFYIVFGGTNDSFEIVFSSNDDSFEIIFGIIDVVYSSIDFFFLQQYWHYF